MDFSAFRDPQLAKRVIEGIDHLAAALDEQRDGEPIRIMEVCGTHTMAIAKNGLRAVMPPNIILTSGPGCPVCVTANADIDVAIALAADHDLTITTFGDMLKVPGSYSSINAEKGEGADVRVVYSPLDALQLAQNNPDLEVVFISVGFETTTPIIAATIKRARDMGLDNFSVYGANKTVPKALRALADDPEIKIDALLLPGHVSTIIGLEPYRFLSDEFGIAGVIAGFEPIDILQGIYMLLQQMVDGRSQIEIAYARGVHEEGNPRAVATMNEVFEPADATWRGLGVIDGTGLQIRDEYAQFDAVKRHAPKPCEPRETPGCACGEILRGVKTPPDCRIFGKGCTPEHPIGPCMVSSEGSCAAYYRYQR
ncbi:MAG: hydrogenase formation protein HypD [Actinomycetia bacterium]|nr:hydrogenase formation protein HypD [Actinomycetes bacterium]